MQLLYAETGTHFPRTGCPHGRKASSGRQPGKLFRAFLRQFHHLQPPRFSAQQDDGRFGNAQPGGQKKNDGLVCLPFHGGSGNAQFQGAARPRVLLPARGLALFGVGDDFQGQFHAFSAPVSPRCLSTRSAYLIKRPPNKSRALPTVASRAPPLKASISSKSCIRLIPPA